VTFKRLFNHGKHFAVVASKWSVGDIDKKMRDACNRERRGGREIERKTEIERETERNREKVTERERERERDTVVFGYDLYFCFPLS